MGKRLHVAKQYVVKYADCSFFNWKVEEVNSFLQEFCDGYCGNDEDWGCYSDNIEIPKESFASMLEMLNDEEERKKRFEELGYEYDKENMPELDYLIEGLNTLYENSDPDENYIYLAWF